MLTGMNKRLYDESTAMTEITPIALITMVTFMLFYHYH